MFDWRNKKAGNLLLLILLLVGAGLRIWGLEFGFPIKSSLYIRPDESLLIEPGLHFLERWGDPLFYVYPALVIELTAALFQFLFTGGSLLGLRAGQNMVADFAASPSAYFLVTRWISVLAGVLTVYVVYRLALRLSGSRPAGLIAAMLYAISPLAVRDAHFGVTDNVMVLFLSASLLAGVGYVSQNDGARRGPAGMGAWFGLAAASKYTAFLLGPRLLVAVLFRDRTLPRSVLARRVAAVTLLPAVIFLLLNPYVLLNLRTTFDELLDILRIFYLWQPGDAPWTLREAILQVLRPLRFGPGGLVGLAVCGLGVGLGLRTRNPARAATVLLAGYLGLHILALIPFRHLVPYRYLLPVLPLVATFAAVGFLWAIEATRRLPVRLAVGAVLLFCVATTLDRSVRIDHLLASTDTRTLAGDWIEANVPSSMPVVLLCPPEAEPQVYEHRDSVLRRTQYVRRRYGEEAGHFISRLYLDQLADPRRASNGRQLYRFPDPQALSDREVAVVTCSHPLRMGQTPAEESEKWKGNVLKSAAFPSCSGAEDGAWDWIDAMFIPFTKLDRVQRPGPNIEVRILDRGSENP